LIPGLLSSSYLPPSQFAVALQLTNLHALHVLLETIRSTERADRWRGQVLDAVGRNWIGIEEHISLRELTGAKQSQADDEDVTLPEMQAVQALLKVIVGDLVQVRPDMCQVSRMILRCYKRVFRSTSLLVFVYRTSFQPC
jgi:hypothetical protein